MALSLSRGGVRRGDAGLWRRRRRGRGAEHLSRRLRRRTLDLRLAGEVVAQRWAHLLAAGEA